MRNTLPVIALAALVVALPHGTLETLALVALLIVAGLGLWRTFKPNHNQWDVVDRASEYALPCGHIRGQHWNYVVEAWCCNVCNQPDPRKQSSKNQENKP
jgi:hypothetical protein